MFLGGIPYSIYSGFRLSHLRVKVGVWGFLWMGKQLKGHKGKVISQNGLVIVLLNKWTPIQIPKGFL